MSELEELKKESEKAEKLAKAARGGFDTAFKGFVALALTGILIAFVQQLTGGIPSIPEIDGGGNGGVSARCSVSCGRGTRGATIPASCGACPSNTYKDSEYTSRGVKYLQCVCR